MMGIGIWQLLIILAIVLLLFGTRRLRNMGSDLGGFIRGFRQASREAADSDATEGDSGRQIDVQAQSSSVAEDDDKVATQNHKSG